jgi:class 3 adenylate cyclase/tetratricopeptide (TPR) repeat protein
MKCLRCQHENPPAQNFCGECGARLIAVCPSCKHENPPRQKFCGECGTVLAGAAPPELPPGRYTPKHLAERILGSRAATEGERKQVTVLFADLKASMELLANRDPEEARKILDPVLERMMEAVHRYEGTVNQVMGDGVMALFGAPLALEDHAVRACYAALMMQASVKHYAEGVGHTLGVPLQIRVGLNSGEVVVRSIGNDLRMDYSAIGQTTHLAARMEQSAVPGSVQLASSTLKLAQGYVQVQSLGAVHVRGLSEPIDVFELTGVSAARSRIQAAAPRGLTQFIGRSRELAAMSEACSKVSEGKGQVVAVMGEPGVGKSRLFWEFTRSHMLHGWLVAGSGAVSYGKTTPYLPVIDLLRGYFHIEPADDARRVRELVSGKVLTLDRQLENDITPILSLLNVPGQDMDWERLDPPQRRQRILDACKRLILLESLLQPLLLMFEDLHWIDSETQALLDMLVDALPAARILLLVNYRPEYQLKWASRTYCVQLRMNPLAGDGAGELLEALLGNHPSLSPLRQLVMTRTEGNPLFIEESVSAMAETGVLAGARGDYRLNVSLDTIRVPATIQTVLAARIDRLVAEDKRLLQTASVIGKDVPLALLRMTAEDDEEAIQRGLARLQEAEFVYEAKFFPDLEYTFKHALTHEVTYGSLLHERRRTLHALTAEAIERRYPDRLAEHIDQLAHHAFRGELWDKAVTYLRQCGARAITRSAYREALTLFETALAAAEHLPDDRHRTELMVDIRFEIRSALWPMGELPRVALILEEAQGYLGVLHDPSREARLLCYLTVQYEVSGDQQQAIELGRRAVTLAAQAGDRGLEAVSSLYLGQAYYIIGDFTPAENLLTRSIELLQGELIWQRLGMLALPSVLARAWLAWALAERGEFDAVQGHSERAVQIGEAANQPFSLMFAYLGAGVARLRKGDLAKAQADLERALDLCRRASVPLWAPVAAAHLGHAYLLSGRGAEASALLDEVLAMDATGGLIFGRGLRAAYASEVNLRMGRENEAIALAEQALKLSRQYGEQGHEAWALRCRAEIYAQQNQPRHAEDLYSQCLARAEVLGMRPLSAHCYLGLGELYAALGDAPKAQECLERALLRYREMGVRLWLEQAESALRALQVLSSKLISNQQTN